MSWSRVASTRIEGRSLQSSARPADCQRRRATPAPREPTLEGSRGPSAVGGPGTSSRSCATRHRSSFWYCDFACAMVGPRNLRRSDSATTCGEKMRAVTSAHSTHSSRTHTPTTQHGPPFESNGRNRAQRRRRAAGSRQRGATLTASRTGISHCCCNAVSICCCSSAEKVGIMTRSFSNESTACSPGRVAQHAGTKSGGSAGARRERRGRTSRRTRFTLRPSVTRSAFSMVLGLPCGTQGWPLSRLR